MSEMHANADTDADKYILNGVEVMPNEFIEIVTNFLEAQHSRVIRLNARIAELEAEKCVLIDQQREVKNILIDKNLHIDSLYEEGYKLQQRIAELEDWAYNNFETNNGKDSPNDTQIDALVYGKDSKPLPCPFCGAMEE